MPTEPAQWSIDELIPFGKYILLNKLSAGATAAVYRAKIRGEAGFERLVTIKRILPQMAGDPEFVETFVREAKICARLNHANICPIYELGKVGESLYMALEWVAGKDLGALARRLQYTGRVMPPLIAAWIASRLCDALDYAHSLKDPAGEPLGIVHQDLSPANILIGYEGQVKLIDFGLAKASGRAQATNVDALKQKLGYMSPELVLGTSLDARSDVFGVGVCLYEMVTGRRLFAGSDDIATLKLVSSATVPPPSALVEDTPDELEMIMMKALERDPAKRWHTAAEMGQALSACIASDDPTFGTRRLTDFMRELFGQDMQAEQRRLNDLLSASKDPAVIEQRKRFFASPSGAAAIAKAEAARRAISTRPPPRKLAPSPVDEAPSEPVAQPEPAPQDEATNEELTTFQNDSSHGETTPPYAHQPEELTQVAPAEEELTTFRPEPRTARVEPVTLPPPPAEPPQPRAATHTFEDEATSYFEPQRNTDQVDTAPPPSPALSVGPFDEEATHIFFSQEDAIGLPALESEPPAALRAPPIALPLPALRGPEHPNAALRSGSPGDMRSRPSATATGKHRPLGAPPPAAWPAPPTGTGQHRPIAAGNLPFAPSGVTRGDTVEFSMQRPREPKPLLWLGLAMLLFASVGLLVKSPLGISLGLRAPTEGVIEIRTTPPMAAAVRLDGIYRGRAPLRLEGVRTGARVVTLEADGYVTVARNVTVEGGATTRLEVPLERLPPSAANTQ